MNLQHILGKLLLYMIQKLIETLILIILYHKKHFWVDISLEIDIKQHLILIIH